MATHSHTESDFTGNNPRQWQREPCDEDLGYETTDWQQVEGDDGTYRFLPEDYVIGDQHPVVKADDSSIVDLADHV